MTRDTASAFASIRSAVTGVTTGKNDRSEEWAAPLAIPKQLSSKAAIQARRNNLHVRAKGPSWEMYIFGAWFDIPYHCGTAFDSEQNAGRRSVAGAVSGERVRVPGAVPHRVPEAHGLDRGGGYCAGPIRPRQLGRSSGGPAGV